MKRTFQIITLVVLSVVLFNPMQASGQFFFMENEKIKEFSIIPTGD